MTTTSSEIVNCSRSRVQVDRCTFHEYLLEIPALVHILKRSICSSANQLDVSSDPLFDTNYVEQCASVAEPPSFVVKKCMARSGKAITFGSS